MLTIIIFAFVNIKNMGRKGDIVSKVIGVRAPIKVYTKLLNEASDKGISLSEYCVSLLSKDNFNQGGQTQIEYKEKVVYRDKIVEVPIEYHHEVEIDNPKIIQENVALKKQIEILELEIKKLTPKKYTLRPTKNKEECHPDYQWEKDDRTDEYVMIRKFENRK